MQSRRQYLFFIKCLQYCFMLEHILLLLAALLAWLFYTLYLVPRKTFNHYSNLIPSLGYKLYKYPFRPIGIPILQEFKNDSILHKDVTHSLRTKLVGYDVALSNVLGRVMIVIINPGLSQHMNSAKCIDSLPKCTSLYRISKKIASRALVLLEGQEWKNRRKLLSKVFTWDYLIKQTGKIEHICDQVMDQAEKESVTGDRQDRFRLNLFNMMNGIYGRVATELLMDIGQDDNTAGGKPLNEAAIELNDLGIELGLNPCLIVFGTNILKLNFNEACRRFNHLQQQVWSTLRRHIQKSIREFKVKSEQNPNFEPSNIIEHMIQGMGHRPELQEDLVEEMFNFTMAGTSSALTVSLLFYLFQHPHCLDKLRRQINEHISPDAPIDPHKLKDLKYMKIAIKEANRLSGPTPFHFFREANKDTLVGDLLVRKGTLVANFWKCNFFNPQLFDQPEKFIPQRWLQTRYSEGDMQTLGDMMFNIGPKACIGKQLAYIEIEVALITFLRRYNQLKELSERVFVLKQVTKFEHTEVQITQLRK